MRSPLSSMRNPAIRRVMLLALLFFVYKAGFSQSTVTNTFSYGNGIDEPISLFRCESSLNLNVQWDNALADDTLVLFFPNSFEISGLSASYTVIDSTGGFVEIQVPVSGASGSTSFQFILKNCQNEFASVNSPLNTSNLQFQSYLIHPTLSDVVTHTYNGSNMYAYGGTPRYVQFSSSAPAFVIIPGVNCINFQDDANQIYSRRFNVRINTPVVESFILSISQESDVEHQQLRLIDNNLADGNSGSLVLNNDTGATSILAPINLATLSNYFTLDDTTRVLTFEQVGKLKCLEPNTSTIIRITRPCCPSDFVYFAVINGRMHPQAFFPNL